MNLEFFKPSDFRGDCETNESLFDFVCRKANAKLERDAVKVYTNGNQSCFTLRKEIADDHQAFVINIQPIKECEHKFVSEFIWDFGKNRKDITVMCNECKKVLEPTGWRVRE